MSNYSSGRILKLTRKELELAMAHGRREDETSRKRKVRDEEPLTWVPEGVSGDPLDLLGRYDEHVKGAFIPKSNSKQIAIHLLVRIPDCVPVGSRSDAQKALDLVVQFAQQAFDGRAVFAARLDRDERSLDNVDLFLAPRYVKRTARNAKDAISLTKHLKEHAKTLGRSIDGKDSLRNQGRALQDLIAAHFIQAGYAETRRGIPKSKKGDDRVTPELAGMRKDIMRQREAVERDRRLLNDDVAAVAIAQAENERMAADLKGRERASAQHHSELMMEVERERIRLQQWLDDQWGKIKVEKDALRKLRAKLDAAMEKADALLKPIMDMATSWRRALPSQRPRSGSAAAKAIDISDSVEVQQLMRLRLERGKSGL